MADEITFADFLAALGPQPDPELEETFQRIVERVAPIHAKRLFKEEEKDNKAYGVTAFLVMIDEAFLTFALETKRGPGAVAGLTAKDTIFAAMRDAGWGDEFLKQIEKEIVGAL